MSWTLLSTGVIAAAVVLAATLPVGRLMTRWGVVDAPDGRRKLHPRAVPLAGGLAVWFGTVIAILTAFSLGWVPAEGRSFWIAFAFASAVLCGVGLADDKWKIRGRHKLAGQILAASVLVAAGLVVRRIQFLGADIEFGVAAVPLTVLWLVGAINAINLIDGMDGLASMVGGMIGLALCAMAAICGKPTEALVVAALAGSLIGFLRFNLPPARVFLGDTGSMLIGLVLGVVAVRASLKGSATVALAAPVAIWTLPLFDVGMAIMRRKLTGRSIYATDRGHLHHRLAERGLSARRALLLIVSLCAVTTSGALASVLLQREWIAPVSALAVIGYLIATRNFGHSECLLMLRRTHSFARTFLPAGGPRRTGSREHRLQLQGTREWDRLWESLVVFAERFGLIGIELDLSIPCLHEEFFASWERPARGQESARLYRADVPLSAAFGPIGSLRVSGYSPNGSACEWIAVLIEGLRGFETQIAELVTDAAGVTDEASRRAPSPATAATVESVRQYSGEAVLRRQVAGVGVGR